MPWPIVLVREKSFFHLLPSLLSWKTTGAVTTNAKGRGRQCQSRPTCPPHPGLLRFSHVAQATNRLSSHKGKVAAGPPLEVKSIVIESESGVKVTGARKLLVTSPYAGRHLKDEFPAFFSHPGSPSPPSTVMPVFWQSDRSEPLDPHSNSNIIEHPKEWKGPAEVYYRHCSSNSSSIQDVISQSS